MTVGSQVPAENGASTTRAGITTVRSCDGCTLCCKLMRVPTLKKAENAWCPHCRVGAGCGIYDARPDECEAFVCGYLLFPDLSAEWKPAVSHLIIIGGVSDGRINIVVDPARPDAWRRQPYYRVIKDWSRKALAQHKQTVLTVAGRSIVVLPDRDIDLGGVRQDEVITVTQAASADGKTSHEVFVVDQNSEFGKAVAAAKGAPVPFPAKGGTGFRKGRTVS